MIVIIQCHKAKRLQDSLSGCARDAQHFSHPMNRTGLRLERNLHKVPLFQALAQAQDAASHGNALQFTFGALAILELHKSRN